jgi:hypothetical protein
MAIPMGDLRGTLVRSGDRGVLFLDAATKMDSGAIDKRLPSLST